MFKGPSDYAGSVDAVMLFIVGISFLFLVGITIAMIYFVIKYNRKRHPVAKNIEGNTFLEILWIAIPTLLALLMFYFGYAVYSTSRDVPDNAITIKVTARMWAWSFEYPNGKKSDTLYIPVNTPVKFLLKSVDVNHAFYIPKFRIKEDVTSHRENYFVLTAKETGNFDIACAEYCGLNHSLMYTTLHVIPISDYYNWISEGMSDMKKDSSSAALNKQKVDDKTWSSMTLNTDRFPVGHGILVKKGCVQCHSFDGSVINAPSFKDLSAARRTVLKDNKEVEVIVDDDYLVNSVLNPNIEIVKGYKKNSMPSFRNRLSDEELSAVIEALKTFN
jgi:cytochrome c oxidase subunit 2